MKAIYITLAILGLAFVGVGCGDRQSDTKTFPKKEEVILTLPDYDETNVEFGGGDDHNWQPFPKRVDLSQINFDQLPKCVSGERLEVEGAKLGLSQKWDDEATEIVDVCREPDLGLVALLASREQLTVMPDGEEECLDDCDDSRFALIDLEKSQIKWTRSVTLGVYSEGWGSHCEIDRVLAEEKPERVLFYCGAGDNGMVSRWYVMTMDGAMELPLGQVQWLESMTRQEYNVIKEDVLSEFRRQKAFKPEWLN